MSFPTGWTSSQLKIDNSKVSGTSDLTDFPVLINDVALGTTGVGTAIWSNSQGQEINTNRFLNDANLQGYWRLNGNANDTSSNGYNLTNNNSVTYTTGKFSDAGSFNGTDQYLSILDASAPNLEITQDQTWSCWIYPDVMPQNGKRIMGKRLNGKKSILFSSAAPRYELAGLSTNENVTSTISLTAGNWYHIVGVYDSTNTKLKIFVNGIKTEVTASGSATDTNDIFSIGAEGSNGQYFDGLIDDVAIFNRALTDAEIQEIYQGGADIRITTDSAGTNLVDHEIVTWDSTNEKGEIWAKLGTVQATADTSFYIWYDNGTAITTTNGTGVWSNGFQAVYHLNNGGAAALDSTSNNYTLTSGTSVPTQADGQVGSAVDFNGSTQYMSIADGSAPNLEISSDQAWSAWVYLDTLPSTYGYRVMHKAKLSNAANRHEMYIDHTNSGKVIYWLGGLSTNVNVISTGSVSASTWTHIAGVYDSANSKLKVFINGVKTEVTASGTVGDSNADLIMAASRFGSGDSIAQWFDGKIDQAFITNDAKTDEWIATYYNNTHDPATFILTAIDYTRAISDNLSITDVIYREADFNRENTDNLAIADTVIRTFDQSITIQDNIVIITDQVVTTAVNIITIAQDIVGIDDTIFRQVDYSRNPQDTITLDDITDRSITYNRILDNSVGITDTIFFSKFIYASVLDNISIADSVNIKSVTSDVENPIIKFMQIDEIKPTIYNITNG